MIENMEITKEEMKGILKAHINETEWEYNNWDLIIERIKPTEEFKEYGTAYIFPCYQVDLIFKSNGALIQAEPHL